MTSDELKRLWARKEELEERLEEIRADLRGGLDRDLEEQAQQLENRETLMEIDRVTREELGRIEEEIANLTA